jgi:hypothetical protein
METKENRLWDVQYVLPKDESKGRRYSHNAQAAVICDTARQAIDAITAKYADATIISVQHRGMREVFISIGASVEETGMTKGAAQ